MIGFSLSSYQVYNWVVPVKLLPDILQFPSTIVHGFIHIYILGATNQMVILFSMFHNWREVDHFTMGWKKYNYMYNIMNIVYRAAGRGVLIGKESDQKLKLVFYVSQFESILISQNQYRWGWKGWLYTHMGGFINWSERLHFVMKWVAEVWFQGNIVYILFVFIIKWLTQKWYREMLLIGEVSLADKA